MHSISTFLLIAFGLGCGAYEIKVTEFWPEANCEDYVLLEGGSFVVTETVVRASGVAGVVLDSTLCSNGGVVVTMRVSGLTADQTRAFPAPSVLSTSVLQDINARLSTKLYSSVSTTLGTSLRITSVVNTCALPNGAKGTSVSPQYKCLISECSEGLTLNSDETYCGGTDGDAHSNDIPVWVLVVMVSVAVVFCVAGVLVILCFDSETDDEEKQSLKQDGEGGEGEEEEREQRTNNLEHFASNAPPQGRNPSPPRDTFSDPGRSPQEMRTSGEGYFDQMV